MKTRSLMLVLAALVGCSGKKDKEAKLEPLPAEPTPVEQTPAPRPSQAKQPVLPELVLAVDAKRAEKIALGHALFFDKRISGGSDRACYSCHQNADGTGGHDPIAIGSGDKPLTRHSPALWNVGYWRNAFYWDGRAKTLEDNVKAAWGGGNMAGGDDSALDKRAAGLVAIAGYKKLFDAAFPGTSIKAEQVDGAIAEYLRTLVCKDTAYDKFAAGDKAALSEAQQRGLDVFAGKGKCVTCHAPPYFSTAMAQDGGVYFNVGIGTDGPEDKVDPGRMKVTNVATDWAAFKPPSLRNITKTAPYFHNGSVATLDEAVKLMSSGGIANKNKTPLLEDTKLSDTERADLTAFLGGLDCPGALEEPKLP